MGDRCSITEKDSWSIFDDDVERGMRYGENPDQPAAIYELINGNIVLGDVRFFDPTRVW